MVSSLLVAVAWAAPVEQGLQAQVHPEGFAFLAGEPWAPIELETPLIETTYDCYDLTIEDFDLTIQIDSVDLQPGPGELALDVQLGEVRGTYWDVTGDTGWLDLCFDFSTLIELVELQDGRLTGTLAPSVVDGQLLLEFTEPPVLSGIFTSDIDWFPDSVLWAFTEGLVLDEVASALETTVPPIIADFTAEGLLDTELGGVPVALDLADVRAGEEGLYASVDVDVGGPGAADGAPLDLAPRNASHLAVGVTDDLVQDVLDLAWDEGLLDPQSEDIQALIDELLASLGLSGSITTSLGLGGSPQVTLAPDGLSLGLDDLVLEVANTQETLVSMQVDVSGVLDVQVAAGGTELTLSVHELDVVVDTFDVSGIVDDAGAQQSLQATLEQFVAEAATESLSEIPIYTSQYAAFGYVLRIDDVEAFDGAVAAWATIFDGDDLAVDDLAPDTEVSVARADDTATATITPADDREGPLEVAYRLDGGSWSAWQTDTTVTVEVGEGTHTFEAIARDAWGNVDDSPALATFEISAPPVASSPVADDTSGGCGCAGVPRAPVAPLWLPLLALARRRRASLTRRSSPR